MIIRLVILTLVCAATVQAQEIDATVALDARQLRSEDRAIFSSFTRQAQEYFNSYRWTNNDWTLPKIKMSIQVSITQSFGDGTYSAQLLVVSQRGTPESDQLSPIMRILDQSWQFRYTQGAPMMHAPGSFNSLVSMFDFYAYLAIGCDADTRADLGGTEHLRRAYDICMQGNSSSTAAGWGLANSGYSRASYVGELGEPRFEPLRHLTYSYHVLGLDRLAAQPEEAMRALHGVVDSLVIYKSELNANSVSLDRFLDAKYLELAQLFVNDPNKARVYQELETIDPSHQSYYEEYRNK